MYSDVNQLINAKINNFSLVQIIELLSEFRFKYMGPYLFDKICQLAKYSLAFVSSTPSSHRGEHWVITTQWHKT